MKRLWIVLAVVLTFGFTVLGWVGSRIYQEMPPIPERIVTTDGQVALPTGPFARARPCGRRWGGWRWARSGVMAATWRPIGRPIGCIASASRSWTTGRGSSTPGRTPPGAEPQAALRERLRLTLRANRYDPATGTLTTAPSSVSTARWAWV